MIKKFIVIFVGLLIFSCAEDTELVPEQTLVFKRDVTFKSGFKSGFLQKPVNIDGENYFCAQDYVTNKKIKLFSLTSDKIHEINFKPIIINENQNVATVEIINLDTILVLTVYTNLIYMINSKGEIWKKIDLNPYFKKFYSPKYKFETKSYSEFLTDKGELIFRLTPYLQQEGAFDFEKHYLELNSDSLPLFFKVKDIFADSLNTRFGCYEFYKSFTKIDEFYGEFALYAFCNKKIIVGSNYSDSLYIVNTNTLEVEKKVQLTSKFTKIGTKPPTLKQMKASSATSHIKIQRDAARFRNIIYLDSLNLYFCSLVHQTTADTIDYDNKPSSILVLDSNFTIIDEIQLDKSKYLSYAAFNSGNDIYVINYPQVKNDDDFFKKYSFSIFRYE